MSTTTLPPKTEMYRAVAAQDRSYEGVFFVAVRTTGIFCRPGCAARCPREENVEFFATAHEALLEGFRPCRRCRPLQPRDEAPPWLAPLLSEVERDPARRITDRDLRARGLSPGRVRRWFRSRHGITFHAYQRSLRLGLALGDLRRGDDLSATAYGHGFESLSGFRDAFRRLFGAPPARGRELVHVRVTRLSSPLGPLIAAAGDDGVCLLEFADRRALESQVRRLRARLGAVLTPGDHPHLELLEHELGRYFAGALRSFSVPVVFPGTAFQEAVWRCLRGIPYGETRSYEEMARAIGRPRAVRAVGRANGDNRIAVLLPCHRVVGSDGELRGYGGGLWRKRRLLDLERAAGP